MRDFELELDTSDVESVALKYYYSSYNYYYVYGTRSGNSGIDWLWTLLILCCILPIYCYFKKKRHAAELAHHESEHHHDDHYSTNGTAVQVNYAVA